MGRSPLSQAVNSRA